MARSALVVGLVRHPLRRDFAMNVCLMLMVSISSSFSKQGDMTVNQLEGMKKYIRLLWPSPYISNTEMTKSEQSERSMAMSCTRIN
jgi:hypothetical protein